MGQYTVGDQVILDGSMIVTITSWPQNDEGFFSWSHHDKKADAEVRGNSWYGTDRDGKPVNAAASIEMHKPIEGGVTSTLPPLDVAQLGALGVAAPEVTQE